MMLNEEQIDILLEVSKRGFHKTLDGGFVKLGTQECHDDLQRRIEDMLHHRNDAEYGSDARSYFSGILRVYRRKMRENDKMMATELAMQPVIEGRKKQDAEKTASRTLRLAGLL